MRKASIAAQGIREKKGKKFKRRDKTGGTIKFQLRRHQGVMKGKGRTKPSKRVKKKLGRLRDETPILRDSGKGS